MGRDGGEQLGSSGPKRRLSPRVQNKTKTINTAISQSQFKTPSSQYRDSVYDRQRSSGKGPQSKHSRLLFQNFCSGKENRRIQAYNRPKKSQQVSHIQTLQNGVISHHQKSTEYRDVGIQCGFEGRLFPHTYSPFIQEIPQNIIQERGLPVQSPAVWGFISPMGLYQGLSSAHQDFEGQRYPHSHVPRRLAGQELGKGSVPDRQRQSYSDCSQPGLCHKLGKIGTRSDSGFHFCRGPLQSQRRESGTITRKERSYPEGRSAILQKKGSSSSLLPENNRSPQHPRVSGSLGEDSFQSTPVESDIHVVSSSSVPGFSNQSLGGNKEGHFLVVRQGKSVQRGTSTSHSSPVLLEHRCVPGGMGSPFRREQGVWPVGSTREETSHKRSRTQSCQVFSDPSQSSSKNNYFGENRQQHSSCLYQSPGRYQIIRDDGGDIQALPGSPEQVLVSKSQVLPRVEECSGRLPFQAKPGDSLRMVIAPSSDPGHLQGLGHTPHRSVCNPGQHKTSSVCVSSPRQECLVRGQSINKLGRSVGLRLPPNLNSQQGLGEDNRVKLRDHSDSSMLGNTTLVQLSAGSVSRKSTETTSDSTSVETNKQKHVSQKPSTSQTSCMETAEQNLREQGFTQDISKRIVGPQRDSTRRMYSVRWSKFCHWYLTTKGRSVVRATIPEIAEFLNELFIQGKVTVGTIEGYKTAIADGLKFISDTDVSGSIHLSNLIKSYHKDRPVLRDPFPKWNLALVLNFLLEAPFEPIQEIPLKFLTWKTAFLVLLATSARSSEIHALEYSSLKFHESYKFMTIEPVPEFKAKNQGKERNPQLETFNIPALAPVLDRGLPDRKLCPVRAVKVYRSRTSDIRKGTKMRKLFISYKQGFQTDIHKNTFTGWIKALIKMAYSKCPNNIIELSNCRPHEIRALSASVAFKANLNLDDVLKSCTWKKHTTFTNHYLKDISMIQDDLYCLGPLVVARNVLQVKKP